MICLVLTHSFNADHHDVASKGQNNVAFISSYSLSTPSTCIDLLVSTSRLPEAAFFARTYAPSRVSDVLSAWKTELDESGKGRIAKALVDPSADPGLFEEDWEDALRREGGEEDVEVEAVLEGEETPIATKAENEGEEEQEPFVEGE